MKRFVNFRSFKYFLVVFLVVGCKPWSDSGKVKVDANQPSIGKCDTASTQASIKELDSFEADLVLAQRLKFAVNTGGACNMNMVECKNKCTADFGTIGTMMYPDSYDKCQDLCVSSFQLCMKKEQADIASGKISAPDTNKLLSSREQLLERREAILKSLHACTSDSATALTLAQQTNSILPKDAELDLARKTWKNLKELDMAVFATYRYTRGTAVDTPARRGYMSRDEWKKHYEADSALAKFGLAIFDAAIDGFSAFDYVMNKIFTADMTSAQIKSATDMSEMAIPSMHASNIAKSCNNAKDLCSAISCLGHRTQEIMSVRDNILNVENLESIQDGRKFALCRHYAPTFVNVCTMWAKDHNMGDKIKCTMEGDFNLLHAYPIIEITQNGKSYQYIYDLLNDPMTPDLVPLSAAAKDDVSIPCLAVK
jgi:hypothetical protein